MKYASIVLVALLCAPLSAAGDPEKLKLPEAAGAKALEKLDHALFLNVNEKGQMLLPEGAELRDSTGKPITALTNANEVGAYLQRHAKEDRLAGNRPAGGGVETTIEKPPEAEVENRPILRSTIVFRVEANTLFEKVQPIWKATQDAGFAKSQWRAARPKGAGEGQLTLTIPESPLAIRLMPAIGEPTPRYVVQVRADAAGKIAKITVFKDAIDVGLDSGIEAALPELPGEENPKPKEKDKPKPKADPPTDLGADVAALTKKLQELRAAHKGKDVELALEIDGKLLHSEAIKLIDTAVATGFPDVSLALLKTDK